MSTQLNEGGLGADWALTLWACGTNCLALAMLSVRKTPYSKYVLEKVGVSKNWAGEWAKEWTESCQGSPLSFVSLDLKTDDIHSPAQGIMLLCCWSQYTIVCNLPNKVVVVPNLCATWLNFQDLLCWGWVNFRVTHADILKHVRSVSKQSQAVLQRMRETSVLFFNGCFTCLSLRAWYFLFEYTNLNLEHLLGGAFALVKQKLLNPLQR